MSEVIGLPERRRRQRVMARLLLAAGLVLALVAAGGTYLFIGERVAPAPVEKPTVAMVVAAEEIPARTVLTAASLRVVRIDPAILPRTALADPAAAVGRITSALLAPNQPVLPSMLSAASGTAFTVIPPGERLGPSTAEWRALSIQVADGFAVGGNVQPGDVVDLVYTLAYEKVGGVVVVAPPPVPGQAASQPVERAARIVFERVPVLARSGAIYTVRMDAASAERVAVLQNSDLQVLMLLRAPSDDRATRATGATLSSETLPYLRIPGVVR